LSLFTRVRRPPADGGQVRTASAPRGIRRVLAWVVTALACLLVLFALVAPNEISRLTPGAFLRIPIEALFGVALVLVLPGRARRIVAVIAGALLGLLTLVKIIDMGFFVAFDRPFDLVSDWSFFGPAMDLLTGSVGHAGAIAAVVGVAILAVAAVVLMALSVLRLSRLVAGRRTGATRALAVLGVIWIVCAVFGVEIAPNEPIASRTATALAYRDLRQVGADLRDQQSFAQQANVDAFRNTPGSQLLTALRGKDVMLTFVESYGRVAVQDADMAPQINAVLDAGTNRLRAAGFDSRSAFLTSSTTSGGSWLAHSTLQSGLWINNQQRYGDLVGGNRFTLTNAFHRAGWRTVADDPANTQDWPEAKFYGYDQVYDDRNVGYHGPNFSYATMPDQYTLSAFQRAELAKPHPPVMAEIDLVSSHWPWAPLPQMIDWNNVGDGSVFNPMPAAGNTTDYVWADPARVHAAYAQSIEYSLNALISYVQTYGDNNLVLVFLGDHQPNSAVIGSSTNRDVPITIVAKDPAVLDKISSWGWQDGLRPSPQAPVWPMDSFRDRFLTAFGP
jgi:hypothetical protein